MKPQDFATAAWIWDFLAEHILKKPDAHRRALPMESVQEESYEVLTHQSSWHLTDDWQSMLVMKLLQPNSQTLPFLSPEEKS